MSAGRSTPDDYSTYSYSGILEVARGAELAKSTSADKVAEALRQSPVYDHYKGKQWWRACDNKSFQDMWIVRGRGQVKGDWGSMEIITKIPASEELDRTCAVATGSWAARVRVWPLTSGSRGARAGRPPLEGAN